MTMFLSLSWQGFLNHELIRRPPPNKASVLSRVFIVRYPVALVPMSDAQSDAQNGGQSDGQGDAQGNLHFSNYKNCNYYITSYVFIVIGLGLILKIR